jgi:hypothetical protein
MEHYAGLDVALRATVVCVVIDEQDSPPFVNWRMGLPG